MTEDGRDSKADFLGLNIDLGQLLSSPEGAREQLEELREKLKKAGGSEVVSNEEWRRGGTSINRRFTGASTQHARSDGPLTKRRGAKKTNAAEVVEPQVDVFHESGEVVVIAEVPSVDLVDLELRATGDILSLSTRTTAAKSYRKEIELGCQVKGETLKTACRNGILEVRLKKGR